MKSIRKRTLLLWKFVTATSTIPGRHEIACVNIESTLDYISSSRFEILQHMPFSQIVILVHTQCSIQRWMEDIYLFLVLVGRL
jgi:hypothetical protein